MPLIHFFRSPGFSQEQLKSLLSRAQRHIGLQVSGIETEFCFNVEVADELKPREMKLLIWLLSETFEPNNFGRSSFLDSSDVIEVGPRLSFNTAWCTNAVAVFHACGLSKILRIERSRRYRLKSNDPLEPQQYEAFLTLVHDRMTETRYEQQLSSFETGLTPESPFEVPVLEEGRTALEKLNVEAGLAFDDWDLDYYTNLFIKEIGRNPTNVECFDIAQSNSEHSRHWFFKGRMVIDGEERSKHLMALLQDPLLVNPMNSTIAFKDNSSAIKGYRLLTITPRSPGEPAPFQEAEADYDIIFTAETHNFPSGVAPFPGAETGTGGRIRDVQATGRGALVVAGTAAYCVGNLNIPGYSLPWEDPSFRYPSNLSSPLEIEIEASNGASDYGNKFGEPVIQGYTRSFGLRLPSGERREWIKPIMFSGGIGQLDATHRRKGSPEVDMWVVKIGGPAYRIGMGGGAASSMVQGENVAELDFNAVQRGDAKMEQCMNRIVRACVEMGDDNPIISAHDLGAGGDCNALPEIIDPAGGKLHLRRIPLGDKTLSVLEYWGNEAQERDSFLIWPDSFDWFKAVCDREGIPCVIVGQITGDGWLILHDENDGTTPVNLPMKSILLF